LRRRHLRKLAPKAPKRKPRVRTNETLAVLDAALERAQAAAAAALPSPTLTAEELKALASVLASLAGAVALRRRRDHQASPIGFDTRWKRIKSAARALKKPLPGERRVQGEWTASGFVVKVGADGRPRMQALPEDLAGDMLSALEAVRWALKTDEVARFPKGKEQRGVFTYLRASLERLNSEFADLTVAQVRHALTGAELRPKPGAGHRGAGGVLAELAKCVGLSGWTKKAIEDAGRPLRAKPK